MHGCATNQDMQLIATLWFCISLTQEFLSQDSQSECLRIDPILNRGKKGLDFSHVVEKPQVVKNRIPNES